jgi:drug/metabolite transporter (DMT)-like permease
MSFQVLVATDEEQPLLVIGNDGTSTSTTSSTVTSSGYAATTCSSTCTQTSLSECHSDGDGDGKHPLQEPPSPVLAALEDKTNHHDKHKDKHNTKTKTNPITQGHVLLFLVAILYGSLNVTLRGIYSLPDPPSASVLSTVRGWMAVFCFVPFLMIRQQTTANNNSTNNNNMTGLVQVAAELALWNFGAQALVNVGLLYIPSARAAFFTQLSVVITPGIAALSGHKIHVNVGVACGIALMGLILLCKNQSSSSSTTTNSSAGGGGDGFTLGFGDILTLCGAISWSTYIYRLSAVGNRYDNVQLQAWKNVLLATLYSFWCLIQWIWLQQQQQQQYPYDNHPGQQSQWVGWQHAGMAWVLLFYSALGPGCIADVLQQQGQSTVTATVANILLSLEPVFTAIFGRFLLGELTSGLEKMGGCLIMIAAIVATLGQE